MRIDTDLKLDFDDVLLKPKRSQFSSRSQVILEREFSFKHSPLKWKGVPIIAANMDGVGTFSMAKVLGKHNLLTAIRKHYQVTDWNNGMLAELNLQNIIMCIGTEQNTDHQTLTTVLQQHPEIKWICVDVANGYQQKVVDFVKKTREAHPDKIMIVGNVITAEMVEEFLICGADIVKCGIGPGSVCSTRLMTGVGMPQLSGIIECADAAHGIGGHIIADGGCVFPGDIAKAFGAGSDFVMLGGMLAGHVESEQEFKDGQVVFYGMSSDTAMEMYNSRHNYRGSEGKTVVIKNRGPVKDTMLNLLGGLRSACTYIGARKIKDMPKCTTFLRVTTQGNTAFT